MSDERKKKQLKAQKRKARRAVSDDLNITSMMDMMTIILVFLLKSYSAEDFGAAPSDDLTLPVSTSVQPPKLAVNVSVSKSQILVDGNPVVDLVQEPDADGRMAFKIPDSAKRGAKINDLFDALLSKAEQAKRLSEQSANEDLKFKGEILLLCDRELPFSVVREVMFTAGQAEFSQFRFIVIKGSG